MKDMRRMERTERIKVFMIVFLLMALTLLVVKIPVRINDPQDTASDTSIDGSVFVSVYGNYEQHSAYYDETGHLVSSNNILTDYLFAGYLMTSSGSLWPVYGEQSSFWGYGERSNTFYVLITQMAQTKAQGYYTPVPVNAKAECWIGPPGTA